MGPQRQIAIWSPVIIHCQKQARSGGSMWAHQRSDSKAHKVERCHIFAASGEEGASGSGADAKFKLGQAAHSRPRALRPTTLRTLYLYLIVLTTTTINPIHAFP